MGSGQNLLSPKIPVCCCLCSLLCFRTSAAAIHGKALDADPTSLADESAVADGNGRANDVTLGRLVAGAEWRRPLATNWSGIAGEGLRRMGGHDGLTLTPPALRQTTGHALSSCWGLRLLSALCWHLARCLSPTGCTQTQTGRH